MIMFEQSRRLSQPLRWGRRERTAVAALAGALVLALAGLGIYALTSGSAARADCIDVTFASTLGAAQVHECGPRARNLCAAPAALAGATEQLQAACRRAGFPFRTRG